MTPQQYSPTVSPTLATNNNISITTIIKGACVEIRRRVRQSMQVKLIPGPRDEEKITIIQNARKSLSEEDFDCFLDQYCSKGCDNQNVWFDALYYASEYGDTAIKGQEAYFNWLLADEEYQYFIERLLGLCD